jgi:hypothetical protein
MKTELINTDKEKKENWFTYPTKRNLLIIVTVWFISTVLLVLSITNFFTESFFSKEFFMIYVMMLTSTWVTGEVVRNYFKKSSLKVPDSEKPSE